MPTFRIGQDFEIYCDGADLADALDSFQPASDIDEVETTKLGNSGSKSFMPALAKGTLSMQGCFEIDETHTDRIENILRSAFSVKRSVAISASYGALAVGQSAFMLDANQTNYTVNSTPSGLVMVDVSATGANGVKRGVWLYKNALSTAAENGPSVDNSAATSNGGLFHAHVYRESDSTATSSSFKLQGSADNAAWFDIVEQVNIATPFGYITSAPNTLTIPRYLKVVFETFGGKGYGVACFARF